MKAIIFLITGTLFVATAFGSDPYAEERFKAKYGRYSPAEEARRDAAKNAQKAAAKSQEPRAAEIAMCDMPNCCKRDKTAQAKLSTADTYPEALFRAKYGRPSPVKEVRIAEAKQKAAESVAVAATTECNGHCCTRGE